jgi:hypothetical protein
MVLNHVLGVSRVDEFFGGVRRGALRRANFSTGIPS